MLEKLKGWFRTTAPTEPGVRENRLIAVATASSEAEAAILTGKLQAAGIRCSTRKFGDMLSADLTSAGGVGSYGYTYDVLVREEDERRARKLLKQ